MRRWLILTSLLLALGGCATLDAWRGAMSYNHKTGQVDGEIKGAGEGGVYNDNTGLNLTSGDNTIPALVIVGLLGVGIISAYPIQRSLRLHREQKSREYEEWRESLKEARKPPKKTRKKK